MKNVAKAKKRIEKYLKSLNLKKDLIPSHLLAILIWALTLAFVIRHFYDLRSNIPLLYSLPWGESQIVGRQYIYLPLILSAIFILFNLIQSVIESKYAHFTIAKLYGFVSLLTTSLLSAYTLRIVWLMSEKKIILPQPVRLIAIPLIASSITTIAITPLVIKFARKYNLMDDPLRHKHPGMLLTKPTPRAGGLAFLLGVLLPSIFLLPITSSQKLVGLFLGATISVLVGLKDDRKDVSPYIRIILQVLVVFIVVMSGVILIYIPNPFGKPIMLDRFFYTVNYMGVHNIHYFSVIAAMVWILVTMNFMSFANGSDGIYAGLVSITGIVTAILTFNSLEIDPGLAVFIKLAALISGSALGMAFYTWPPQKLLWGYGATAAALFLSALSIIGSTKVATTLLVLIIPFLDGSFAILRRIRRGQLPFWGDREHLHHKLLGIGWSKTKIAVFYWTTTFIFGCIGLLTSGKTRALSVASLAIAVIILIASLNYVRLPKKNSQGG